MYFVLLSRILTVFFFFFFNDTATTEIYTLSLHDALPISRFQGEEVAKLLDAERRFGRQIHRRTRALYARYTSPNVRSRYASSLAITRRWTSAMTTGSSASGHRSFRSSVPPT